MPSLRPTTTKPPQLPVAMHHPPVSNAQDDGGSLREITDKVRFLLNEERREQSLVPLMRSSSLDNLARMQARYMAQQGNLERAFDDAEELKMALNCTEAAECVHAGSSFYSLVAATSEEDSTLILSSKFTEYGVGVAQGKDQKFYLCLLLRQVA